MKLLCQVWTWEGGSLKAGWGVWNLNLSNSYGKRGRC
jgi:hypothetical protein